MGRRSSSTFYFCNGYTNYLWAITGAVIYGGYKAVEALNARNDDYSPAADYANYVRQLDASSKESEKKKSESNPSIQSDEKEKKRENTNPFEGAVGEGVIVVDPQGNAIPVKEGNWLGGSKDGTWIQEMQSGDKPKEEPSGVRKDGGGYPYPDHKDPRANAPMAIFLKFQILMAHFIPLNGFGGNKNRRRRFKRVWNCSLSNDERGHPPMKSLM